ncbi:AbrB/MazE/SpoVT family DNA-binding domain-containing protein [Candidatus Woesearchaeota archaeon]|nr:AbrB/MazE/SpoVT family DNA-binding domain-containing protein [Candidatus Woesearchaeota archaeon]
MAIFERRAQAIGKSLLVSLPKKWALAAKLRKGSAVKMVITDQGSLMLMPELMRHESRAATILFDDAVQRRFIREYFNGNEDISIISKQTLSDAQREEIHQFLERFMNVQIVDESASRISVKCFRIEHLSIEDCLKRMWHLSLNALDDALARRQAHGLRKRMTPFYYMLVMQVRRFLSEGAFARQNEIPLIRALDCRMAAEKMQRVGEITEQLRPFSGQIPHAAKVRDLYAAAVSCFVNSDYEKAVQVWRDTTALQATLRRARTKKIVQHGKSAEISQILRLAKEISMLVR